MATKVGTEIDTADLLKDLLQLEFDAADAYDAAIKRLQNPEDKSAMQSFMQDHLRHITDLNVARATIGAGAVTKGDFKTILTQGKVILGSLLGDRAILAAMKTNEEDTNTAYERAAARDLSPQIKELMEINLRDERRHRAWIVFRLETYYHETQARREKQDIGKNKWVELFDDFTKNHRGWVGTLEVFGEKLGAQIAESEQLFEGISADVKSTGPDRVTILLGSEPGAHKDHVVTDPKHVRMRLEPAAATLEIEGSDGIKVLLRIHPARQLGARTLETGT
jgi:rubrerythrin